MQAQGTASQAQSFVTSATVCHTVSHYETKAMLGQKEQTIAVRAGLPRKCATVRRLAYINVCVVLRIHGTVGVVLQVWMREGTLGRVGF